MVKAIRFVLVARDTLVIRCGLDEDVRQLRHEPERLRTLVQQGACEHEAVACHHLCRPRARIGNQPSIPRIVCRVRCVSVSLKQQQASRRVHE